MNHTLFRVTLSLMLMSLILAVLSGILNAVELPIFDDVTSAWIFVGTMISLAVSASCLAALMVWES